MDATQTTVWVLSTGSGDDGDEWQLLGVYASREAAVEAGARYQFRGVWATTNEPYDQIVGEDMF